MRFLSLDANSAGVTYKMTGAAFTPAVMSYPTRTVELTPITVSFGWVLCGIRRRPDALVAAMKGDRVEIVVDTGNGSREYEVVATRAGRRVEITIGRGVVQVSEVTRSGTVMRTARFMASRVLSVVEHPHPAG